jgi:hypothetical protein
MTVKQYQVFGRITHLVDHVHISDVKEIFASTDDADIR